MQHKTTITIFQCDIEIKDTIELVKEEEHKILIATQNKNYYERKIKRLEALKRKIQKRRLVSKLAS